MCLRCRLSTGIGFPIESFNHPSSAGCTLQCGTAKQIQRVGLVPGFRFSLYFGLAASPVCAAAVRMAMSRALAAFSVHGLGCRV